MMEVESTASSTHSAGPASTRKERGAIAAQACETCRNRKQKCDEQRPRCGTCAKFKIECLYREPQPTKKDKTLTEILARLKSVESKIDGLGLRGNLTPPMYSVSHASVYPTPGPFVTDVDVQVPMSASSVAPASPVHGNSRNYRYVSSVSQMLQWPAVRRLVDTLQQQGQSNGLELNGIKELATPRGLRSSPTPLPLEGLPPVILPGNPSLSTSLPYDTAPSGIGVGGLAIDWDTIQKLSKSYFDLYNFMYPILDRRSFNSSIVNGAVASGFGDDAFSILVLLVLALGEVASTASSGVPISMHKGHPSGIKGGTLSRPPGLPFFNEARKRMGFALTDVSLENVQIFALAGLYYESCGRSMECWRMTVSASVACQMLIASGSNELHGPQSDLVRRLYWHCSIIESFMHMEFELPLTGLQRLDDTVGLPGFDEVLFGEDYIGNQEIHSLEHFASQIILHRLLTNFHSTLMTSEQYLYSHMVVSDQEFDNVLAFESGPLPAFPAMTPFGVSSEEDWPGTVKQLAVRLDQWRGMLPSQLRWQENHPPSFSNHVAFNPVFPAHHHLHNDSLFTTASSAETTKCSHGADILAAILRTRYCYARYLVHRPFVYKALHHADKLTHEDAEGAGECLKSCLGWPIAMSSPSLNKRLVPMPSFWSQNMAGVLILLHFSRQHPVLRRVQESFCGSNFDFEVNETVSLYIEWLRDLKTMDPTAAWWWDLVRMLYGLEQ